MKQYSQAEIEAAQGHVQELIVKLGAALAVWHEGAKNDTETLGSILQYANLAAWRIRWQLGGQS